MVKHRPLPIYTVEVSHNGIRHRAQYTVESQVVTVTYGKATISVQTRGDRADHAARLGLRDILAGNNWKDE